MKRAPPLVVLRTRAYAYVLQKPVHSHSTTNWNEFWSVCNNEVASDVVGGSCTVHCNCARHWRVSNILSNFFFCIFLQNLTQLQNSQTRNLHWRRWPTFHKSRRHGIWSGRWRQRQLPVCSGRAVEHEGRKGINSACNSSRANITTHTLVINDLRTNVWY